MKKGEPLAFRNDSPDSPLSNGSRSSSVRPLQVGFVDLGPGLLIVDLDVKIHEHLLRVLSQLSIGFMNTS